MRTRLLASAWAMSILSKGPRWGRHLGALWGPKGSYQGPNMAEISITKAGTVQFPMVSATRRRFSMLKDGENRLHHMIEAADAA